MEVNIRSLEKSNIISFINKNNDNVNDYIIEAIIRLLPLLNHYEEEEQKLRFKLSLGVGIDIKDLTGRFHVLHTYEFNNDSKEIQVEKLINSIKKVAIFCKRDADVFIVQNDNKVLFGIYFTDLEKTGLSETILMENKFIIFQGVDNKLLAMTSSDNLVMSFDFNDDITGVKPLLNMSSEEPTICRKWTGIFEKVKKTVHGTICLFVKKSWDYENDNNFTESIEELNINLSRDEEITSDKFQDFENKVEILLSMLNFDGITVIDTDENIRAYNLFCKFGDLEDKNYGGGARHRAYSYLKNLPSQNRQDYVAVYFQSQEGIVKFYDYGNNCETGTFNSKMMNGGSNNKYYATIKKVIENHKSISDLELEQLNFDEHIQLYEINEYIDKLFSTHIGIDNFYHEYAPAQELLEYLLQEEKLIFVKKNLCVFVKVVNVVLQCYIGNSYGYARSAMESIESILDLFDEENWTNYFENKAYVDGNLLWSLSNEKPYKRWSQFLSDIYIKFNTIKEKYTLPYDQDDFREMSRALSMIEDEG